MAIWSGFGLSGGMVAAGAAATVVVAGVIGYQFLGPPDAPPVPDPVEIAAPVEVAAIPDVVAPVDPVPLPEAPDVPEIAAPIAPRFDLVRVDAAGGAVIAGRAEANADLRLRLDGTEIHMASADGAGGFVAMFAIPPSELPQVLSLEMVLDSGAVMPSDQSVIISPTVRVATTDPDATPTDTRPLPDIGSESPTELAANMTSETAPMVPTAPQLAVPDIPQSSSDGAVEIAGVDPDTVAPDLPETAASAIEPDDPSVPVVPNVEIAEAVEAVMPEIAEVQPLEDTLPVEITDPSVPVVPNVEIAEAVEAVIPEIAEVQPLEDTLPVEITDLSDPSVPVVPNVEIAEAVDAVMPEIAEVQPLEDIAPVAAEIAESTLGDIADAAQDVATDIAGTGVTDASDALPAEPTVSEIVEAVPQTDAPAPINIDLATQDATEAPQVLVPEDGSTVDEVTELAALDTSSAPALPDTTDMPAISVPQTDDTVTTDGLDTAIVLAPEEQPVPDTTADLQTSAPSAPEPDTEPVAPTVMIADSEGIRIVQSGPGPVPQVQVVLDTIAYDAEGEVVLTGRGPAQSDVRLYLDNQPIQLARIDLTGGWRTQLPQVDPGTYTLRVDEVSAEGAVLSRVETPFLREEPALLASLPQREGVSVVTVQPGHTLWGIARDHLGEGILYVQVYEANRDLIRDPHWIYPGQIFAIPDELRDR